MLLYVEAVYIIFPCCRVYLCVVSASIFSPRIPAAQRVRLPHHNMPDVCFVPVMARPHLHQALLLYVIFMSILRCCGALLAV